VYRTFVIEPEGKRKLQSPGCRWEDNIKIDLRGTELGDMNWIHLAQNRNQWRTLLNTVMNFHAS
jgi:hypothetical protein